MHFWECKLKLAIFELLCACVVGARLSPAVWAVQVVARGRPQAGAACGHAAAGGHLQGNAGADGAAAGARARGEALQEGGRQEPGLPAVCPRHAGHLRQCLNAAGTGRGKCARYMLCAKEPFNEAAFVCEDSILTPLVMNASRWTPTIVSPRAQCPACK